MQLRVVVALVSWVVAVRAPTPADACAPAPPHGEEVRIAEEEAIILWDPKAKVEHFIRRAAFRSTARSFGFLVPTPTTPTLGEVADGAFATLAERTKPEVRRDKVRSWELGSWLLDACAATAQKKGDSAAQVTSAPNAVRVIATAQVAGFDATTLEADDAGALAAWLGKHGFAATPELTAWFARYVE